MTFTVKIEISAAGACSQAAEFRQSNPLNNWTRAEGVPPKDYSRHAIRTPEKCKDVFPPPESGRSVATHSSVAVLVDDFGVKELK